MKTTMACLMALGLAGASTAQTPQMTAAQARLLYAAGGFPISADGKNPTNRCGKPANPRITFIDMNSDGRKEALFIDAGPCYQPDGRWYAVATQGPNGSWRRILEGPGTTAAAGTMANGWFVLTATSGGKATRLHYNGTAYVEAKAAPAAPAASVSSAASAARTPAAKPADASATPAGTSAGPARDAAIFRAAGFVQKRGQWESGCNDPSTGSYYEPGRIEEQRDLNGDGRPEALITEGGTYCYGMTGAGFWLVSQQANGSWKLLTQQVGIAEFLKTKGAEGFPDISIGAPGFCFQVIRWNGRTYANHRLEYEGKPCRKSGYP